ncbi:MAG: hypothetical protein EKK33_07465 [Bradyrhizobiaceae bacterium]|nr:MAG: hypothetical protein EKK33_07465 [Bradyrhizobiaceae bacterium]
MTTVTILSGPERRRRIVKESSAPAASVVEVARRQDIHPNLLTSRARRDVDGPAWYRRRQTAGPPEPRP